MGLRLRLAAVWTPGPALLRELEDLQERTIAGLDELLREHAPATLDEIRREEAPAPPARGLHARRAAMAAAHTARVSALVEAVGRDEAMRLGRAKMHEVGARLGERARTRLGVGDSVGDLVRAARVMYRVLGIDFRVERPSPERTLLHVSRCALSEWYSDEACRVLSAADEGVVRGLNPHIKMTFKERITAGAPECVAQIEMGGASVDGQRPRTAQGAGP